MHICACACMCAHICPYIGIHTSHLSILKLTNIHFYGYKKTHVYCVFINMHKYMFLHFPIILPNAFQHLVFRVWGTSSNVANGSEAHAHTVFPPKSMSHCFSGRSMGTFFSYKKSLTSVLFSHKKKKLQRALVQKIQNALNSRLAQDSSGACKTAARNQVSGKEVQVLSKYECEVQTRRVWWHCCCHGGHPQLQTTLGAIKCICPLIGSL